MNKYKFMLSLLLIVCVLFACAVAAECKIIYVRTNGSDANNGSTWVLAVKTVTKGLSFATSGDEVWVAGGIYTERIYLKVGVGLYGGFAGTESARTERNPVVHITVLDGSKAGTVVNCSANTVIDGFTIQNGKSSNNGGGIYCGGAAVISGNIITENSTTGKGGGIYCFFYSSTAQISNNTISKNSADSGGGIYSDSSTITISGNTISENIATGNGGGLCSSGSSLTLTNNTIVRNVGASGCGVDFSCSSGDTTHISTVSNNIIRSNTVKTDCRWADGGGIRSSSASLNITSNSITENNTGRDGRGGGIFCAGSATVTITNNTISRNSTTLHQGYGGGIYCASSGSTLISNNTISANIASSTDGGGIYCYGASPTISANLIAGNNGGGIYCTYNSSPTITGNTIVGHSAQDGGGIYCTSSPSAISNNIIAFNSSGILNTGSGTPVLRNNCVYNPNGYNYSGLSAGTGDISVDPLFASKECGNYHIQYNSPCKDAGWNDAAGIGLTDMDGQARILALGGIVDIGADESDGTAYTIAPVIVRVSPDGSDANDGSSWALAKNSVQAGIDAAAASGGEVWVKAGMYLANVTLKSHIYLYGGFTGNETSRVQRNYAVNITILDGSANGSVVTSTEPGYGLSTVDGFTIRNAKASSGGGIYCFCSSPIITNNVITENNGSDTGYAAGIYCESTCPLIANNTITGNNVYGIYCVVHANAMISGNIIKDNNARAIQCESGTICNNTITGNDGAITCTDSPLISDNVITDNNTVNSGGAISLSGYGSPIITNNIIMRNISSREGGGIYCAVNLLDHPVITNNVISENMSSYKGGGIYCCSSVIITNNTIACNSAAYDNQGGGIYCINASASTISNNIIAFNSSGILNTGSGTPVLRNNCVYNPNGYNYSGLSTGTGDISVDPLFASREYGNYHIQYNSSCKDAGWNDAAGIGLTDMDGQARILASGGIVDIGADESDGTAYAIAPVIVRVSSEGNDANDGSSWTLAKKSVQAGIDAAAAVGGEVWVKSGNYIENVTLKSHTYLYGGFAGTETTRDQRDWKHYTTILDGNASGSVVTIESLPSYGLSTVDGFTIKNAKMSAIYCHYSTSSITNNTVADNNCIGILCSGASPSISGNVITGNRGMGIICGSSSSAIFNNVITANSSSGISCSGGYPVIRGNLIAKNNATVGAGIRCSSSMATISNNTIVYNNGKDGSGIYYSTSSLTFKVFNNIIAFNSSGICNTGGTPVLKNNCVYNPGGYNYSGLSAGPGDISTDPLLFAPWLADYHLRPNSPCINTGDSSVVLAGDLDLDGKLRIFPASGTVDMGCYEYDGSPYSVQQLSQAKSIPEQLTIQLSNKPVTAAFPGAFYIEDTDRTGGLRVLSSQAVSMGDMAGVTGQMVVDNGERALLASSVVTSDGFAQNIPSLFMSNRALGGGGFFWNFNGENCGQEGIANSFGLNNIGMLISSVGKFTYSDEHTFTIDDGSGSPVKCVAPDGVVLNSNWSYVRVTGISSCEKIGGELSNLIRIREQADITAIQ